jgi:hypothetical protein
MSETLPDNLGKTLDVFDGDVRGTPTFELRIKDPPVLSAAAARGGYVDSAEFENGDYHIQVQVPPRVDVRSITDIVQEKYPPAELLTRRQVSRTDEPPAHVEKLLQEDLTARQRTALKAACQAGFFTWPRTTSGEDVAESLGVSPPTFHQHLRKAARKVFSTLLVYNRIVVNYAALPRSGLPDPRSVRTELSGSVSERGRTDLHRFWAPQATSLDRRLSVFYSDWNEYSTAPLDARFPSRSNDGRNVVSAVPLRFERNGRRLSRAVTVSKGGGCLPSLLLIGGVVSDYASSTLTEIPSSSQMSTVASSTWNSTKATECPG